jgi:AmmeMemoRadiSam system protein A
MSLPQSNSQSAVGCLQPSRAESGAASESASQEFSNAERTVLLGLAHDSIVSVLQHREICLDPPTPHFAEPRGAFTSLYLRQGDQKELRGCVGYVLASCAVYRAVAETARAAAFEDHRFRPVTMEEAPNLEIELSILSPAQSIRPDAIEVGRHGLLIAGNGRRGLLLPQVPVEHGWDRLTFLEQTCRKAGLPLDAWKHGASIEAFTAEVFGEKSSGQ